MTKIESDLYLNNKTDVHTPSPELGKDEFIKILMTQLQNQDPLNPMEDKDFIAQMATFSSLEQMMNMAKSMDTLVNNQLVSPVIQYSHMIGKKVSYESKNEDTNETKEKTSKVVAVSQKDGWAILELENGEKVFADGVNQVKEVGQQNE